MARRIFAVALVLGLLGSGLAVAAPLIGGASDDAPTSAGDPQPAASPTPPGHQETPGKKKGCNKGKGKKEGCKKIIKPAAEANIGSGDELQPCSPYRPGELGAGAPTLKLTEENGYFNPRTVVFDQPGGVKTGLPTDEATGADTYFNIQVEPSSSQTGLWALLEFEERRDYDLILFDRKGNEIASSRGFNVAHEEAPMLSAESQGGESTNTSETLTGIRSSRCAGYTLNVSSAAADGGEVSLRLWLGPIGYTPAKTKA